MQRDLSKDENERKNLRMKKKITHNNTQTCQHRKTNKMEKQADEIKKSKDDSSRMSKAIKALNKMIPKTQSTNQSRKSTYRK